MQKAFLFDMDGVLANTENEWVKRGYGDLIIEHFGRDLWSRVPMNGGMSLKGIFDAYVQAGFTGEYDDFHQKAVKIAESIYPHIVLTEGIDGLIKQLKSQDYLVGIVSSSPLEWINLLTKRLQNHDLLDIKVSVNNHKTLKPKPSPDPYNYAMHKLKVEPPNTFILEDSKTGITAALASGAQVICFTAYNETQPSGAHYYASTMLEVGEIVDKSERP